MSLLGLQQGRYGMSQGRVGVGPGMYLKGISGAWQCGPCSGSSRIVDWKQGLYFPREMGAWLGVGMLSMALVVEFRCHRAVGASAEQAGGDTGLSFGEETGAANIWESLSHQNELLPRKVGTSRWNVEIGDRAWRGTGWLVRGTGEPAESPA